MTLRPVRSSGSRGLAPEPFWTSPTTLMSLLRGSGFLRLLVLSQQPGFRNLRNILASTPALPRTLVMPSARSRIPSGHFRIDHHFRFCPGSLPARAYVILRDPMSSGIQSDPVLAFRLRKGTPEPIRSLRSLRSFNGYLGASMPIPPDFRSDVWIPLHISPATSGVFAPSRFGLPLTSGHSVTPLVFSLSLPLDPSFSDLSERLLQL
ncbi:hypothetical protein B0H11DRAFT_2263131 [Mycena galericulata]|nr:hypothetical protein B0H11DRAFT_2263131 [Mycena galericulata]